MKWIKIVSKSWCQLSVTALCVPTEQLSIALNRLPCSQRKSVDSNRKRKDYKGISKSKGQMWTRFPTHPGSWMLKSRLVKVRHCEKATKFEKISHGFWQNSCFYSLASKQVGDVFKFLLPFQKTWTLLTYLLIRRNLQLKVCSLFSFY